LLYTVSAAAQLSISRSRLYKLTGAGDIRWLSGVTGGRRIERAELERFVAAQRAKRDAGLRSLGRSGRRRSVT
jgi:hypothetical protein